MTHGADFFRESAETCRRMNRRGILLSRHGEQIPKHLPAGVEHVPYVPFSELLPNVAALVHHGGIGTTAQCLAAGCPQLIMPLSHDQFDNARRVEKLGVGASIPRRQYRAARVQNTLLSILDAPSVQRTCAEVARRFDKIDAIAEACNAIERFAADRIERFDGNAVSTTA
jgi:UDP:flavonoid glycosyltransferase YjiC (YdhE family)